MKSVQKTMELEYHPDAAMSHQVMFVIHGENEGDGYQAQVAFDWDEWEELGSPDKVEVVVTPVD